MTIQEVVRVKDLNSSTLDLHRSLGVDMIQLDLRDSVVGMEAANDPRDGRDRTDFFRDARRLVEDHGMRLNCVVSASWPEISLAAPDRNSKIEAWCTMLRSVGAAGIPAFGYNFKPMGNFRTRATTGRGNAQYSTFDYDEFTANRPPGHTPPVDEATMFANLIYFLERVIPVAEEAGVRMALHPDDPPIPEPLAGVAQIASSLAQFRRIFAAVPARANGMLFCQGCVTEMGEDVYTAIQQMARSGRIVWAHFRNVRGAVPRFQEVFIDEGDVDMLRAMRAYRDGGFSGPFMMDHTPTVVDPGSVWVGRAYAIGYIRALIRTVYG